MSYDFDSVIERRGTDSIKWNVGEGELPMWVADMDFKTAPEITEAILYRAEHGVYGYNEVPDIWYDSYIGWWARRHDLTMKKDWLVFCTGVVPAISSAVRKLTTPGENVLIQTPVYNVFFNSILNNGCRVVENPLVFEDGEYRMDLDDLEKKLSDPQTNLMILCNPHNPVGKIWDKKTLASVGKIAARCGVTVISDEIHCDLTTPGCDYVPFASASDICRENSITCIAPTKAFNLAGLQTAAVCVPDGRLRHKITRALNTDEVAEPGTFAVTAAVAAFERGEAWLDELREYLYGNRKAACDFIRERIPSLVPVDGNATYLLWVNVAGTGLSGKQFAAGLREKTGLFVTPGAAYGAAGRDFFRLNFACPRSVLEDGLGRLEQFANSIKE